MDEQLLKHIIEALLFAADESLRTGRIREIVGEVDGNTVRRVTEELQKEYADAARGIQIEEVAGGFRMLSNPGHAEWVEQLRKREKSTKLSQAALETLAIIAYKQPIHRADIENIRGVGVDSIVRGLQERGLIRITGRAEVLGRPFLYGTTRRFLEVFGLKSLKDLPDVEELQ
ncbi:SMC-Scp complex subunit ScpB, partial [bacterium]|nr:SMC-Scp complex subunit ScpB [bacterium]